MQSHQDFQAIVQQAPVGITIFRGPALIVEMANTAYLEIVDKTPEEFIGKPFFDAMPEVKITLEPLLKGVLNTGVPYHGTEFPVKIHRFGASKLTYFNFTYQPLKDANGTINGVIAIANEVTDLVRAKHSIVESERQFRNMVMQSPIPMTIFRGPTFRIEMANKMMLEQIWRRKEEDVIGKSALDIFPELHEQKYPDLLKSVLETGARHREVESYALISGEDGLQEFYLDFEYAPLTEHDGQISGVMITATDMTQRVKARRRIEQAEEATRQIATKLEMMVADRTRELALANEELVQINRELERSNADLEKFAYAASHDMKEPIRKILYFSEMMQHQVPPELKEMSRSLEKVRQAAIRMNVLIEDLLAFAQSSVQPHASANVDIKLLVGEVTTDLEMEIQRTEATISCAPGIVVRGYEAQIRQALYNLISNAIKFRTEGAAPLIHISSEASWGNELPFSVSAALVDQCYQVISVRDNGIGFDQEHNEKIFEVFSRLHGRDKYNGSGIGLSIVRRVMEQHGGFVRATSSSGGGSLFQLYFPKE
jgi:PAS domain S-box-containing protein